MPPVCVWFLIIHHLMSAGNGHALVCWYCISENCDINPEDNSRAEQKNCLEGQVCQKVMFEMISDIDDTKYTSTVRSCADECIPHDDFKNCSSELHTSRGCVERACCSDDDLCNHMSTIHIQHLISWSPQFWCLLMMITFWTLPSLV